MTQDPDRLNKFIEEAKPFILGYWLVHDREAVLEIRANNWLNSFVSLRDDSTFIKINDTKSPTGKRHLISADNVNLITQSDDVIIKAIRKAKPQLQKYLDEQIRSDNIISVVKKIDPDHDIVDTMRMIDDSESPFFPARHEPITIEKMVDSLSDDLTQLSRVSQKGVASKSDYFTVWDKAFFSFVFASAKIAKSMIKYVRKYERQRATRLGMSDIDYSAKYFLQRSYPKCAALVTSGKIAHMDVLRIAMKVEYSQSHENKTPKEIHE